MTEAIVNRLTDKINELGNQKILLVDQVSKMRKQLDDLNQEMARKKVIIQQLESEIEASENAISKNDDSEKNERKIDEMVKEIDKCLAILNK